MAEADGAGPPNSHDEAREHRLDIEAILSAMRQPLLVLDRDLAVETANRTFYEAFEVEPGQTEGRRIYDLGNGQWNIPELRRRLDEVLPSGEEVRDFRVEHGFESIGRRVMVLNAHRMPRSGRDDRILLVIEDITEQEHERWELQGQKEFAEKIVDASRDALLILDWDLRVKLANDTFCDTFEVDRSETEGRMVYELGNGQWDIPKLRELLEDVLPENNTFDDFKVEHEFEEIGRRIMVLNARRIDHLSLILLAIEDQTEARRAAAALKESEATFRALVESASQAMWEANADGAIVAGFSSWSDFTGQSPGAARGHGWLDAVHPDDRDRTGRLWRDAVEAQRTADAEFRLQRREGGWRWTRLRAAPVRDDGRILKWVGMNSDISARKDAEEQRKLLLGELNHRVKNIFAVIRALASQSDGERTTDEFRRVFLGRLDALVNAHALALESRWESVDLGRIAEQTMRPYAGQRPGSVEIRGDPLRLEPRRALSLSLVLHELATNAVKHGALSAPEGNVRLGWSTSDDDGRAARMTWDEAGGPSASPPERPGFGTKLLGRVFEYELGGKSTLDYREDGLHFEAWFPLD